ncbi:unnamed protein product [Cladocopium goreaui]|uniref:Uncharacterized protein n=1 Tax=Cladocopium goreaui TaxID=2562237 RepID=A0A9P1D363_9DINO|nr:unnamed protein product [Cladocopium goreaui]
MCVHIYIYIHIYITCRYECCLYPHASKTSPSIWIILAFGPRFHLDLSLCINLSDIAHLGNSVRILLEGPLRSSEDVPGSFSLKLDKSGVRINREKVVGYDSAGAFVKALGIRALSDPEDAEGPPVEKERPCVWLTHLQEMAIKRSFKVPLGCQGMHKGCPRLY